MGRFILVWVTEEMRRKARYEADGREWLHRGHNGRLLSNGCTDIGLIGEQCFEAHTGCPMDWSRKAGGDDGYDFIYRGHKLDVKTARKPYYLLRERDKEKVSDILVLAGINKAMTEVCFIGWAWDHEMLRCPTRDFGIVSHAKAARLLRSMESLTTIAWGEELTCDPAGLKEGPMQWQK